MEISNPQIPKLISGRNFQTVGSSIWGKGPKGAESVIENMTPAQAKAILDRVPAADIKAMGDYYGDFAKYLEYSNPNALSATPTPIIRAQLMNLILQMGQ